MSSLLKARIAFVIAIGLLLACALIVYGALHAFTESERAVQHAQHIQVLLGTTESAIAAAARARLTYVFSGDADALSQYNQAVATIPTELADLRQSTRHNSGQQAQCDELEKLVGDRMKLWEDSINLKKSGQSEPPGQPEMTRQSVAFADGIVAVTQKMRHEEAAELDQTRASSRMHLIVAVVFLAISFITAVLLLFWHYRLVRGELEAREIAESQARKAADAASEAEKKARASESVALASNEAARKLSARLMSLQDEERRRLSRDLHDSTGQYLAAAKMVLSPLATAHPEDKRFAECTELLDRSLREIRTLSHLLHPSGLEEAGFSVAARWYVEGFASRSGITVKTDIQDLGQRLASDVEITLFRILQEALTNIHRHSGSRSAEVSFKADNGNVVLAVRDFGTGIPAMALEQFRASGGAGVGLAGMRERIHEVGGTLDIESSGNGTCVRAALPRSNSEAFAAGGELAS
jgi:signal transduction histidine kinase